MSDEPIITKEEPTHFRVPVRFQVICMAVSLIWFGLAVYKRLSLFKTQEEGPEIINITPPVYQNFGGIASFVTTGLYIDRFHVFNMTANKFVFTGYVWFRFTPGTLSINNLEKFTFLQGDILERGQPEPQLIDDKMLVTFRVKVEFSSLLDYKEFPFDDHKLRITLYHPTLSPEEVVFESSERDMTVKTNPTNFGWNQLNQVVETGYIESVIDISDKRNTQFHPAVTFEIDYERYGVRFILAIILPLLIIFYISLFGFSLDEQTAARNGVASITGILGYRFVIDNLSPKDVGYFMISDYIFFSVLAFAGIALIVHIIALYQLKMSIRAKGVVLVSLHIALNSVCTYFFFST